MMCSVVRGIGNNGEDNNGNEDDDDDEEDLKWHYNHWWNCMNE